MKRFLWLLTALCMAVTLCACSPAGTSEETDISSLDTSSTENSKILRLAESYAYPSLDTHVEYYGWFTSIYGITQSLYRIGDDSSLQPCLADSASVDESGLIWTIVLKEEVCFSNGEPLTAQMAVRNIQRLAQENERFYYLADFQYQVVDEVSFTITTPEVYPTMLNTLASPEMGMLDLDHTSDFDLSPIGTGPFQIKSFVPSGTVEVERNDNYWDGEVKLDGAIFYYMQDDDSKLMAMQNGEIDAYDGVTAAAMELFSADPASYTLNSIPATRLQFYILNENTLSDPVRAAINLAVDPQAIAEFLKGTVTPAIGPFSPSASYGQVTKPDPDPQAAMAQLENAGYQRNANGYYEKDGQELQVNICYYAARSLDTIAVLMQEQLKTIGIRATLTCEEDADATYIATGDFDIALYCMIADSAGDPYAFIDATIRDGSYYDCGGFDDPDCQALVEKLQYETDPEERARLANSIIQMVIDDNAFGFVGLFNKISVMKPGVTGISENCPFDFYRLTADSDIA